MFDFTIITPSFNQGNYISSFFDSYRLAKQSHFSSQLILIDNCSTDLTPSLIEANRDLIDVLIVEPDDGQSSAINKALPFVQGRYVNWINTDDMLNSDSLFNISATFSENPSADVVIGRCQKTYPANPKTSISRLTTLGHPDFLPYSLIWGQFIQPSTFWRTSVFMKYMPLQEDLHCIMDHSLFLRYVLENGFTHLAYTNSTFTSALLHDECKSVKNSSKFDIEYISLYSQISQGIDSGSISIAPCFDYSLVQSLFKKSELLLSLSKLFRRSEKFGFPVPQRDFYQVFYRPGLLYFYLSVVRPTLHRLNMV